MRVRSGLVVAAVLAVLTMPGSGGAGPTDVDEADRCDPIDPAVCLLPFPNDHFTVADETTQTGRRIDLHPLSTPRALGGIKPILPDEWNRNDGFSPGSMVLSFVPGLDMSRTWGTVDDPHPDHIQDIARYDARDAPMLIINATTGERHPFWSELDLHPDTPESERLLILRPAINFEEGTRYLVALRTLEDADGALIPAGEPFASYLAGAGPIPERQAEIDAIVAAIEAAEVGRGNDFDRNELFLAWDFTVASWQNLAGRALHIRDDAFAALGDEDLADGVVEGDAPTYRIDRIQGSDRDDTVAFVHGTFDVPNYLVQHIETPEVYDPTGGAITDEQLSPLYTPHARFFYPPGEELPARNPVQSTFPAHFTCRIPTSASAQDPAMPVLMGHGLLGQRYEVGWSSGNLLTSQHNAMYCGTEWVGMALGDIPQAVTILADPSLMPSLADRAQQGFLNFLYLGRLMAHPDGFAADPVFQDDAGNALFDHTGLVYDGNSQGAIMGGALTALAPDFTRATLGVAGMNYSTLLNRSVDWEDSGDLPLGYGDAYYTSIPDPRDRQLGMALIQMLWDRAEANGYAHHMTDDPYPNTPAHQVLLHIAYADHQVANVSAEVEARTIGARFLQRSLTDARHWSVDASFDLEGFDPDGEGGLTPWNGSALVYWDSGNPTPPNGNLPPRDDGGDPHGDPRSDVDSGQQRALFFGTGWIHDVGSADAYCTHAFPRVEAIGPDCPSAS